MTEPTGTFFSWVIDHIWAGFVAVFLWLIRDDRRIVKLELQHKQCEAARIESNNAISDLRRDTQESFKELHIELKSAASKLDTLIGRVQGVNSRAGDSDYHK